MGKKRRTEQRSMIGEQYLVGNAVLGETRVSARVAENLATLFACVTAISTAIASLPAYIYRRSPGGRDEVPDHPVSRLVRLGPNRHQSWVDFIEWTVASVLLRGNALAQVVTDARGIVTELIPIPWENVSVQILPTGRLVYDVVQVTSMHGGTGLPRRLLEGEVIHLRDRSDDGLVGRSRLSRAGGVIAAGLSVQDFAASMYENGVRPSGALSTTGALTKEQRDILQEQMEGRHQGAKRAGKLLVLQGDFKWNPMSVSPEDAELLSSRRFTTEELARLYQVPPPLVGIWDHSSFTNSETAGRWFAQFTLTPWIRKIEAEFSRAVLGLDREDHELVLDLSAFLRGDDVARWNAHKIAIETKVLDANEVREIEGWNPKKPPPTGSGAQDIAPGENAA